MKRREKKLSVMDWVLVGLLDTLAGVVAGGLMAIWQLPSAYRWRGYWAIGGEWLLVIIAIIMAVRLTHAFQMCYVTWNYRKFYRRNDVLVFPIYLVEKYIVLSILDEYIDNVILKAIAVVAVNVLFFLVGFAIIFSVYGYKC